MPPLNTPQRAARLIRERTTETSGGCLIWTGPLNRYGYARMAFLGRKRYAHQVAYELAFGPIERGLDVDHVCHTLSSSCGGGTACEHRACVNPEHLELVTPEENTRRAALRRTHCASGHRLDAQNTYLKPSGQRDCRECVRQRGRAYRQRKMLQAAAVPPYVATAAGREWAQDVAA